MRKLLFALLFFTPLASAQTQINCPPPNGCQIMGNATITQNPNPPPQTVTITPNTANLSTTGTQAFIATVANDSFNRGVTWTLAGAGCAGATCGTLSASSSASGVAITYTAPAPAPSPNQVTLTAMSVTNPQPNSSAIATISITPPPATIVVNPCTPNAQTAASLNTYMCAASQGSAVAVLISSTSATTNVSGVQVCNPANVCKAMVQGCPPTGSCTASVGGKMATGFYALGLSAGQTIYKVSNSTFSGNEQVVVFDQSNVNSFDTAVIGGSATASATPTQSITTQAAGNVLAIDASTNVTAMTPPFAFVAAPSGLGAGYTTTSSAGTYSPSWIQQSAPYALYSMAFAAGFVSPVIGVTVNPATASLVTSGTLPVTATVSNTTHGVTWALTCTGTCGTLSATSSASGVPITYTAPASVPSPATVTLTATAVDDATKSASSTITITAAPVIGVVVAPTTASLVANGTQNLTCTVTNDSANAGCDWTLVGVGCTGAACGTLSIAHTSSGNALTYTAPGTVPTPPTVTLTAASTTDATKTAAATITITAPAVSVTIAPTVATLNAGGSTQAFTATLVNSTAGVNWTLSCNATGCGTISPASSGGGSGLSGWLGDDALTGTLAIGQSVVVNSNAGPVRSTVCTTAGGGVGSPISPQPSPVVGATVTIIGGPSPSCAGGFPYWQVQFPGGGGAVSTSTYTSPLSNISIVVTLKATSISDPTKSASATINVTATNNSQTACTSPCNAFPEAQGGGAPSAGGRGGIVYEVTCTADATHGCGGPTTTGAGFTNASLRDCIAGSGARTCVFRLSGVITFLSRATVSNPFITIAGQTAPGGGLEIGGANQLGEQIFVSTHDVVVRYMTWDGNNPNRLTGPDSGTVCCEMASGNPMFNIIWDHMTTRWMGNKAFPLISNVGGAGIHNMTIQWLLDYEPNVLHAVGIGTVYVTEGSGLATTDDDGHHNMFVTVDHRLPFNQSGRNVRWVNNLVYNWGQHASLSYGGVQTDYIGNKYVDGNGCLASQGCLDYQNVHAIIADNTGCDPRSNSGDCPNGDNLTGPTVYVLNNTGRTNGIRGSAMVTPTNVVNDAGQKSLTWTGWEGGDDPNPMPSGWYRNTPLPTETFPIVADPVTNLDNVLLPIVGNSRYLDCNGNWVSSRDSQDQYIIGVYQNNKADDLFYGQFNSIVPPPGTPCTSTLHDGIPDAWKTRYHLSLTDTGLFSRIDQSTNRTYLENYLDGLVP